MDLLSSSASDFRIEDETVNIASVKRCENRSTNQAKENLLGRRRDEMLTVYSDDVLCARASALVPQGAYPVLKAPFVFLVISVGLWPKGFRVAQYLLVVAGVVINTYILVGNVSVYGICGAIPDHVAEKLSPWLCYGSNRFNETSRFLADIVRPVLLARAIFGFAQFSGFVLMTYSVLVALKSSKTVISLSVAVTLLTRNQWIKLDAQILLSFAIWLALIICDVSQTDYIPDDHFVIWARIGNIVMWFYIGTPCWIFAVLTYALEALINACFHAIKDLENGTIEDVITIYQQMCNYVFNTVRALKYWFVVHWISFGTSFILEVALEFKAVETQFFKKQNGIVFWIFGLAFLCFVLYPFLYPSLRAASLTSTSGDMLEKLNFIGSHEWRDKHPLKRRRDMNEFLMFANETKCGFRIGRLTFHNGLAWLSAFFGIFGLVMKLM